MNEVKLDKRFAEILAILKREYPDAEIALDFGNEWQLLVAVILSAQCTDVRVNMVTPALFAKYPTVADFAEADLKELEKLVYSTGFYRNKAKNIKAAAERVVAEFGGELPRTMEGLLTLAGVARKTANVVMVAAFGVAEGVVVDTHVMRISGKLGLVAPKLVVSKNAVKIEAELMKIVPREDWGLFSHLLIFHGRQVCVARRPKCEGCPLRELCPGVEV